MDELTKEATKQWTLVMPRVSTFIASIVRDFAERDDVLQETAIAVIESYARYNAKLPFIQWAMGIARNQVGLYFRKKKRDRLVFDESTVATIQNAVDQLDAIPHLQYLPICMKELNERARKICEMRYQQNMQPAEIGQVIEVSANTVAKALQRVRERLRKCIEIKAAQGGMA